MTGHPDDELLSAHLDGEAGAGVGAHLGSCAACRARLAALESVAAAVGAAPEPAPGFLDAAVAAAVAELGAPAAASLTPPAPAPGAGGQPLGARRARGRRWPPLAWVATAAAAVALLGGVSQLVPGDGSGDGETAAGRVAERPGGGGAVDTAASRGPESAPAPPEGGRLASPAYTGGHGARHGGDLGDQSDPAALAALVDGDGAAPLHQRPEAGVSGGAAGMDGTAPPSPSEAIDASDPPCVDEARGIGADLGPLVYVATVRWQGTPGVVLVFRLTEPAGGADRQLYVMSRTGCALLAERRF